jgi:hypothetical protein
LTTTETSIVSIPRRALLKYSSFYPTDGELRTALRTNDTAYCLAADTPAINTAISVGGVGIFSYLSSHKGVNSFSEPKSDKRYEMFAKRFPHIDRIYRNANF